MANFVKVGEYTVVCKNSNEGKVLNETLEKASPMEYEMFIHQCLIYTNNQIRTVNNMKIPNDYLLLSEEALEAIKCSL